MTTRAPVEPLVPGGGHPRDLLAWHGVSLVAMAVMLVVTLPGWLAAGGVAAFAVGVAWCAVQMTRTVARGAYLRLGVCCAAMAVMLLPLLPASWARGAEPAASGHPTSGHSMAGHSMDGPVAGGHAAGGPVAPVLLTAAVLVALALVVLASTRHLVARDASRPQRLAAFSEALLAATMGTMLVALH